MHTVVGLFESRAKARRAKGALIRAHIASPNIVLYDRSAADSSRGSEGLPDTTTWSSQYKSAEKRGFCNESVDATRKNNKRAGVVFHVLKKGFPTPLVVLAVPGPRVSVLSGVSISIRR